MAKRMQEQKEDNVIVAKSKPTTMNLAFTVSRSSSTVNSPIASKSPGILKAYCRRVGCSGKPVEKIGSSGKLDERRRNSNPDAASSPQGREKDALVDGCTGKTRRDRRRPGTPEQPGDWRYRETCRTRIPMISRKPWNSTMFKNIGNRRQKLATSFPCITRLCTSHEQGLLDRKTNLWSKSNR